MFIYLLLLIFKKFTISAPLHLFVYIQISTPTYGFLRSPPLAQFFLMDT